MPLRFKSAAERLAARSRRMPSGCIEWTGYRQKIDDSGRGGYGMTSVNGTITTAHRVAWIVAHGPISNDLAVCHKCDNRACVNVDHLFLGTRKENTRDMYAKNRAAVGQSHGGSKLTESDVRSIRSSTKRDCDLAREYGVVQSAIYGIKKRRSWKHID